MATTNPSVGDANQRALGAFIRSRRERTSPAAVGLPEHGQRRTPGLRREEVAALSGVSLTWFTWLEQGRDINVSAQVLAALSRTLRLSDPERAHLYRLAGELPPAGDLMPGCPQPGRHVLDVVEALDPCPAFVLDRHWDIVGWNRAEAALLTDFAALPPDRRNMLWLIFCWPPAHELFVEWEQQATPVLAQFRMAADEHPTDPRFAEIITELAGTAPDFATWWERHDVAGYQPVRKEFEHPRVGRLALRQSKLIVADTPELQVVVRLPADDLTKAKLTKLADN